jgi:hypothetical protein
MARLLFRLALPAVLLANGGSAASSPVAASQSVTRLWSAAPTARILTEEKSFDNEGATLSGTLHYPESGRGLLAVLTLGVATLLSWTFGYAATMLQDLVLVLVSSALLFVTGSP